MKRYNKIIAIGISTAIISAAVQLSFLSVLSIIIIILYTLIGVVSLRSGIFGPALTRKENSQSIFLTFDDGPDPELTPRVLELLRRNNMKATFFVIAKKAEQYPNLVQQILSEGHTIGSHDLTHPWWANFRTYKSLYRDISKSVIIIESITGKKVTYYRPPVGLSNPHTHKVCRDLNLTITGWSRSARDGGNRSKTAISHLAAIPLMQGDIILMHDCAPTLYTGNLFYGSLETILSRMKKERLISESL